VCDPLRPAAPRKDWTPVERDAGHFLYAGDRLDLEGRAIVQAPAGGESVDAYDRVLRWFEQEDVRTLAVEELEDTQLSLEVAGQR
jgi:hypothetical protein